MAMVGEQCIAIATDHRMGGQHHQLVTSVEADERIFQATPRTLVAIAGLATDVQTMKKHLQFKLNLMRLNEEAEPEPQVVFSLLQNMIYERRFSPWIVNTIVAGITKENKPFIEELCVLGSSSNSDDFVVAGTAQDGLLGCCELFWKPNLGPEDLFESTSQALLAAINRDCWSGNGATVKILTPTKLITRRLKTRMD